MIARGTGAAICGLILLSGGCTSAEQRCGAAGFLAEPVFVKDEPLAWRFFTVHYVLPVRDWLNVPQSLGKLMGRQPPARDLGKDGSVPDSSFYTNRDLGRMSPAQVAAGPCRRPPPRPPWRIRQVKNSGGSRGFFGQDADGRRFLVKLDDPGYPELGSGASIICSRILWSLGYHVPASYIVTIAGTGDQRFDGRRALASEFVAGRVHGNFKFDWLRNRREFRALRLACAWLNHCDCVNSNTLVATDNGQVVYYLIDFDSALGSWQGRPKEAWRGWRFAWDVEWQVRELLTGGLARPRYDPDQPVVSPAVGRFDARLDPAGWRGQTPNTAFENMSNQDARWMAEKMSRFSEAQLRAVVGAAQFSRPQDARYVLDTLRARRLRILQAYAAR